MTSQSFSESDHQKRWRKATIASLVVGYAGYYICRSNFSVATPLLLEAFADQGIDKVVLGSIASFGVLAYAVGKLFNSVIVDFLGGRRMFIIGMVGSILATIAFGLGAGATAFTVAWIVNRLFQSTGWAAAVKIVSNWVPFGMYGTVMGIVSLSFLFGDVIGRFLLGTFIDFGVGWRGIFFIASATLGLIALVLLFVLKESPTDLGYEEPNTNPDNLFGKKGEQHRPEGFRALVVPLFSSGSFWIVAIMSFGLTIMRESFNFWTPTYLSEIAGMTAGAAARYSILFPLFGGLSVLAFGWIADRWFIGKRGPAILLGLVPLIPVLTVMGFVDLSPYPWMPPVLISAAAFLMIGPYSFLAGAISLDLGGKMGSSTTTGVVDSVGYFGGIVSGIGVGAVAEQAGWELVFSLMAALAVFTSLAAWMYTRMQEAH